MKLTLPKNTFNSLTKKLLSLLVASIAITTSFAQAATDVIATQETTDHGLYQVETQESDIKPTTTIESEPEEDQNVEIRLTDVQNWVIKNAQIGKPAKYTDAISLFGQKTVDTAISQNLIFNFRGFLEEN